MSAGAWSVPVVVMAVAAPAQAASLPVRFGFVWSPNPVSTSGSRFASVDLRIQNAGSADYDGSIQVGVSGMFASSRGLFFVGYDLPAEWSYLRGSSASTLSLLWTGTIVAGGLSSPGRFSLTIGTANTLPATYPLTATSTDPALPPSVLATEWS